MDNHKQPESKVKQGAGAARFAAFFAGLLIVCGYLNFQSWNIPDADVFFHFGHAQIYRAQGPFVSANPWLTGTVFPVYNGDLWYGFHILLIPFTYIANTLIGMKAASVCILAACMLAVYWAVRLYSAPLPYLWPFFFLFGWPGALDRMLMLRPHLVSMGLSALLLTALLRDKRRIVGLSAFLIVWCHLTIVWIVPVIGFTYLFWARIVTKKWPWQRVGIALAAMVLGWLLRPSPLSVLHLLVVQTVDMFLVKSHGVPIHFGTELIPINARVFFADAVPLLVFFLVAIVYFLANIFQRGLRIADEDRIFLWSTFSLSAVFLFIAFVAIRRGTDQWTLFSALFIMANYKLLTASLTSNDAVSETGTDGRAKRASAYRIGLAFATIAFAFMVQSAIFQSAKMMDASIPPYQMKPVSEWLRANTVPGEIIFHDDWALSPQLFLWNRSNYYISGVDPIFAYMHSPRRFWETECLRGGGGLEYTNDGPPGGHGNWEKTNIVLKRDFHASYFLVEKQFEEKLFEYLSSDPHYRLCYSDKVAAVFKVE